MQTYLKHIEHIEHSEDRPDVPDQCPICKGTGEVRHDWINKDEQVINGHRFLRGVNMTMVPCECTDYPKDDEGNYIVPIRIVQPVAVAEPIYDKDQERGICRGCKADDVPIDSNGYCFNC